MTAEEQAAHDALLGKVKDLAKSEIEARGYQNKDNVQALLDSALQDLPLDALRKYEADTEKLNLSIRNIAGELEKVKNIRIGVEGNEAQKMMLRDAVNLLTTGKDGKASQVELLFRNKGQQGEVVLNLRAAATMTTANTIDENDYPEAMIESMSMLDGAVKKRRGTQYIFDVASRRTVSEIEEYTTWLEEGDEQGAFAVVAEGAVKSLVSTALVRNFVKAKKVAAKYVVTEEFVKFRKKAYAIIQDLINDKIVRDYAAILTVDLQAQAASYVGTTLDDTIENPTDFDAIAAVAAQIETLNFVPDVLVVHPQDKWRIVTQKDAEGRYYMMLPMMGADGVINLVGFRVVTSTYQTIGTFTLGESGLFKIEDEALTIRMGYGIDVTTATVSGETVITSVASDFDTNKFRVIVETFFKDYIATNHIGSFVTASFATVKAALLAPGV